jgi:hypothetical protein
MVNFIEFFWGAVKKYLREHCDIVGMLISTTQKWEHQMARWMDVYREGLGTKQPK